MNKFRAKKVTLDGITFDSKAEARRYGELKLLEKAGEISGLRVHGQWELNVNGVRIGKYTADFDYWENLRLVVEDVKSPVTRKQADYILRKKLMKAVHNIDIRETT